MGCILDWSKIGEDAIGEGFVRVGVECVVFLQGVALSPCVEERSLLKLLAEPNGRAVLLWCVRGFV